MKIFSNLKKGSTEKPKFTPKLKRGEYVWKATVYKHKFLKEAEDVELYSERFWIEREAKQLKKSVELGLSRNTVRITQVSTLDIDGFLG